jgi:hypothetical protein
VDKNVLMCCERRTLLKKNQRCAKSAGHVAGTEAIKVEINFTRKTGSCHSRDQDVEGDRKTVIGYWVDSFSLRS